ncbi:unnamed protein product [Rhizophagus irregularis]|nr:unnamed protein product [Rhizophagus irregularis]
MLDVTSDKLLIMMQEGILRELTRGLKVWNERCFETIELEKQLGMFKDLKRKKKRTEESDKDLHKREEVLRKAESHWTKLKEKLVKKIELEEFRVSDHIFKDSINASGIPVIKRKPSFLLHSLPNSDNKKGYIPEKMLSVLLKKVMTQRWLFLMGTSGSGKTRSLYELFCSTYGIYFSLNTEYGSENDNFG